jgi:hypothetical protein
MESNSTAGSDQRRGQVWHTGLALQQPGPVRARTAGPGGWGTGNEQGTGAPPHRANAERMPGAADSDSLAGLSGLFFWGPSFAAAGGRSQPSQPVDEVESLRKWIGLEWIGRPPAHRAAHRITSPSENRVRRRGRDCARFVLLLALANRCVARREE